MALGIYRMGAIYYKICIDSYEIYLLECFTSPLNLFTIFIEFILVNVVCLGNVKNVLFIDLACTSSLQFYHKILPAKH